MPSDRSHRLVALALFGCLVFTVGVVSCAPRRPDATDQAVARYFPTPNTRSVLLDQPDPLSRFSSSRPDGYLPQTPLKRDANIPNLNVVVKHAAANELRFQRRYEDAAAAYRNILDIPTLDVDAKRTVRSNYLATQVHLIGDGPDNRQKHMDILKDHDDLLSEIDPFKSPISYLRVNIENKFIRMVIGEKLGDVEYFDDSLNEFQSLLARYASEPNDANSSKFIVASWMDVCQARRRLFNKAPSPRPIDFKLSPVKAEAALNCLQALAPHVAKSDARLIAAHQRNLGGATRDLATTRNDAPMVRDALAMLRKALDMTPAEYSRDVADTLGELALALTMLGVRDRDAAMLQEAVAQYKRAAELHRSLGESELGNKYERQLILALTLATQMEAKR